MISGFRKSSAGLMALLTVAGLATAQTLVSDSAVAPATVVATGPATNEGQLLLDTLNAGRSGDGGRIHQIIAQLNDPDSQNLALWALVDGAPQTLTFVEADTARRTLKAWPHTAKRQMAAERLLERSGLSPRGTIAWFGGAKPQTAEGAMALTAALSADGQSDQARKVICETWRTLIFDEDLQERLLSRFNALLTPADHLARADLLLYGAQGAAARDVVRLLPVDQQEIALARMAVRRGDADADSQIAALPLAAQTSPGLAYERVLRLRDRGQTSEALALISALPASMPNEAAAERLWRHGNLVAAALKAGNTLGAYQAASHAGLASGSAAAEAEFYAGWLAFSRLKNAKLAEQHFERLQGVGQSPLTQARAFYWRGRSAEAQGDVLAAQIYYGQAARLPSTFYGQLAATQGGVATLDLGHDPVITVGDRTAFESRSEIRAMRILARLGARDTLRTFVTALSETVPTRSDLAQLVDLARDSAGQELAMRVVRNGAKRGMILPDRGYPVRTPPSFPEAAERALVLGIIRQESSFDPLARSGVGARGLMKLMPATASGVARRLGLGGGSLDDPDYNMRLGSAYVQQLVNQFSGSYVLAAAAYNAGPGRPSQWLGVCGDPRSTASDPLDFIECIPFSETRDYVMRVLEATQIYRAKLAGGATSITLAADLKRGGYGYLAHPAAATVELIAPAPSGSAISRP